MTVLTRLLTAAMMLNTWSLKAVWSADKADSDTRCPNILIAIADDQSWQQTSAALQKGTLYLSLKVECPYFFPLYLSLKVECPYFFPAAVVEHQATLNTLRTALTDYLTQTHDSRMGPQPEVWETYKLYSAIREFPPNP